MAMEEKEVGSMIKAKLLINEFEKRFFSIKSSIHPYALPGETAGKSSNVAFAARRVFANHQGDAQDVIITVMDGMFELQISLQPRCNNSSLLDNSFIKCYFKNCYVHVKVGRIYIELPDHLSLVSENFIFNFPSFTKAF